MLQVLGVVLLCVNPSPKERPTMKDVTTMLKEIRLENDDFEKPNFLHKGMVVNPKAANRTVSPSQKSSQSDLQSCMPRIIETTEIVADLDIGSVQNRSVSPSRKSSQSDL
ncbi:hypothetical protein VIGAN_04120900 [Vigna angularis var. angularis]|uniref:Serine-threonine/tyrosine-protein kinase catalytic domain-containing protein n=1 Tax=Vigna angularis var. angularis TaxID=157739 RepID=A0A0S3RTN5_PHAAN|nr:hypothetical protein VIGAN_04120900 [Vigna angularis var. angularis]